MERPFYKFLFVLYSADRNNGRFLLMGVSVAHGAILVQMSFNQTSVKFIKRQESFMQYNMTGPLVCLANMIMDNQ